MKTTIIFLRHAKTQTDPTQHAKSWILSDLGRQQALNFVDDPIINTIDVIHASNEEKSVLTAAPIADKLHKEITRNPGFNEVKRGDEFLSDKDFQSEKRRQLEDWDYSASNGESGHEALARFETNLEEVINKHKGKTILLVSHGTILNLYFAKITKTKNQTFDRWQNTAFCGYGIVTDGKVVKDIIS